RARGRTGRRRGADAVHARGAVRRRTARRAVVRRGAAPAPGGGRGGVRAAGEPRGFNGSSSGVAIGMIVVVRALLPVRVHDRYAYSLQCFGPPFIGGVWIRTGTGAPTAAAA